MITVEYSVQFFLRYYIIIPSKDLSGYLNGHHIVNHIKSANLYDHHHACNSNRTLYYHIAGNFWGRKLLRNGEKYDFHGDNFCGLLAFAAPKDAMLSNFAEKLANSNKTAKFVKSFLPQKFPTVRYVLLLVINYSETCLGVGLVDSHVS